MSQGSTKGIPIDTDVTLAENSDALVSSQRAVKTYVDAKVADAIVDGVTTVAPSQNAVFDALAGKLSSITTATPTNLTGILKGDGANVGVAVAGEDYSQGAIPGIYYSGSLFTPLIKTTPTIATVGQTAGFAYYYPFSVDRKITVDQITCYVTAGGVGAVCRFGVYSATETFGGAPGGIVDISGSISAAISNTILTYTPSTPITLESGYTYYMYFETSVNITIRAVASLNGMNIGFNSVTLTAFVNSFRLANTYGAGAPVDASGAGPLLLAIPIITLRVQ